MYNGVPVAKIKGIHDCQSLTDRRSKSASMITAFQTETFNITFMRNQLDQSISANSFDELKLLIRPKSIHGKTQVEEVISRFLLER